MKNLRSLLIALPLLLAVGCGDDDPEPGILGGTITATGGGALAGATVTTTPATVSATTDAQGKYSLELEAGTYAVAVSLDGYISAERTNVVLAEGAAVTVDFALNLATGSVALMANDECGTAGLAGAAVTRDGTAAGTTGADGSLAIEDLEPGDYELVITKAGYLPVTKTATVTAGGTATVEADMLCQTKAVGDLARAYTATIGTTFSGVTTALALHDLLYDTDTSNDPVVISVRTPDHYALGHVPGAINIPWKTVADDPKGKLGEPNSGKTFVDYCYTGHTGAIAAGVLGVLGYKTMNMKFGVVSWTRDAAARTAGGVPPDLSKNFATETTANTATATHELPWLAAENVTTPWEAAQAAAKAYLSSTTMAPTISAQDLFDKLNDTDTANDPFIISVRKPEDYAKGHVPGAINIPYADIAKEENLKKIPTDREIVVYCYTGHTGGVATAVLGTLGYHKVKNLKYGILGWTQDATVRAQNPYNDANDAHDYPIVTGTSPGTP